MLVIRAGIYKMPVIITKREDFIRLQSDLGLPFLSRPFSQATSVQNFRTSTVNELVSIRRYKLTCAPIEDSDQSVHPGSLIRAFDRHSIGSQWFKLSSGRKLRP